MDGSRDLYAKGMKPGGERQMPYDLTFKWNLINKTNKQAKYNRDTAIKNKLTVRENQDGGVGRYTVLPGTTRTDRK